MKKIPLSVQIQEMKTELLFRAQVYPRQIQQQPRKRSELEYRQEVMQAVQATLEWLHVNEEAVRAFVESKGNGALSAYAAARQLVARADAVILTDVAGNSFRKVFASDLADLVAALGAGGKP